MITHITEKYTACLQVAIFRQVNNIAQEHNYLTKTISPIVCIIDVVTETGKHPAIVIENLAVGIINFSGSAFSKVCSLQDGCKNIQKVKTSSLTAVAMIILLPWSLSENLRVDLSDPEHARSCNGLAEEQANLPAIVCNSSELSPLQEAIGAAILSTVENSSVMNNPNANEVLIEVVASTMVTLVKDGRINNLGMMASLTINRDLICDANENTPNDSIIKNYIKENYRYIQSHIRN